MPKTKISEFSATPGNNTDIDGINIAEGCAPSGINDAIRELMAQLKDFQAGTAGDSFNGPVGTTTAAAGAFTNLSASGTFALTGDQVQISEGGTGQTTANAAFNALAPSQTSNAGKYLKTDGTNTSWDALDISTADITGTLPVANGGTGVTSSTGTGSVVLSASPTFTGTVNGASLTLSSNFTLSGGTANGVAYLNGSKVLTTGSALSFDGTNFRAVSNVRIEGTGTGVTGSGDGAEIYSNSGITYFQGFNRTSSTYIPIIISGGTYIAQTLGGFEQMRLTSTGLGIGTSSPYSKLTVSSGASNDTRLLLQSSASGGSANAGMMLGLIGSNSYVYNYANGPIIFGTNGSDKAILDASGNFGINATPAAKLDVSGTARVISYSSPASGAGVEIDYGAAGSGVGRILAYDRTGATAKDMRYDALSHTWKVGASLATTAATLDSYGNLGLGVTPSAWTSGGRALDVSSAGTFAFTGGLGTIVAYNAFHNGTNWIYKATTAAKAFVQDSTNQYWLTAGSGTAGNAISFTQAMTLTSGGNLLVKTTADNGVTCHFNGGANANIIRLTGASTTNSGYIGMDGDNFTITTGASILERARITSGGDLLVGTSSGQVAATVVAYRSSAATACVGSWNAATSGDNVFEVFNTEATATQRGSIDYNRAGGLTRYNTTSDYRAKDIVGPAKNTGATIDALKVYEGVMKGATQPRPMMIAHEAQAVVPFCVSGTKDEINEDGTPKYQQMDHASLVPLLIAEIQSLRARVTALETK